MHQKHCNENNCTRDRGIHLAGSLEVNGAKGGGRLEALFTVHQRLRWANDIRHNATHPLGVCVSLSGLQLRLQLCHPVSGLCFGCPHGTVRSSQSRTWSHRQGDVSGNFVDGSLASSSAFPMSGRTRRCGGAGSSMRASMLDCSSLLLLKVRARAGRLHSPCCAISRFAISPLIDRRPLPFPTGTPFSPPL